MRYILIAVLIVGSGVTFWNLNTSGTPDNWSDRDLALIKSLSLSSLPPLPPDPSNRYGDNELVAQFGQQLYFDTRLSSNGIVSCATCHKPDLYFTDGLPLAVGVAMVTRHTPTLVGLSYSPWFYWDGRKDSQWAQALAPLEAILEHNTDRLSVSRLINADQDYLDTYENLFGAMPDLPETSAGAAPIGSEEVMQTWNELEQEDRDSINEVFANLGKALAAYQRRLMPGRSRFDDYADSLSETNNGATGGLLNNDEIAGLKLFIDRGQCVNCHNGPLFTNNEFHNTGVLAAAGQLPAMGRYDGIRIARDDPFNCLGTYSDAMDSQCAELRFARDSNELVGAHKTPTLRNIADTAPYMHAGQLATLDEVMDHYNEAPVSMLSHNEAKPLGLRRSEMRQLQAFLLTLSAPMATEARWLAAPPP